jgi:hypothetical protein
MKYFKRPNGDLLENPIELNYSDLTSVTAKEFKRLLAIKNTPAPLTSEQVRDNALAAIDSHDFGDGRVIQIRTKDRPPIESAIGKGVTLWKMKDNKRYKVTDKDLQIALDAYEFQFKTIWTTHLMSLEEGVLISVYDKR